MAAVLEEAAVVFVVSRATGVDVASESELAMSTLLAFDTNLEEVVVRSVTPFDFVADDFFTLQTLT